MSEDGATKTVRRDYGSQEKDAALTAYILTAGNRDEAAKLAKGQGFDIPASTIYGWATKYEVPRLERLRRELEPRINDQMAFAHEGMAREAMELGREASERLRDKLKAGDLEAKDLVGVQRNSALAAAIYTDKSLLYSGRPTAIVRRDFSDIQERLNRAGLGLGPVDSTQPIELPAASVEEDDEATPV